MKDKTLAQNAEATEATESAVVKTEVFATAPNIKINTIQDLTENIQNITDKKVEKMRVGTVNLKTEYKSFDVTNEVIRRIFVGFTLKMSVDPNTGEEKGYMPAIQLYNPGSETIEVCMQSVLVGVMRDHNIPVGSAVQITYLGDKKGKNGLKYNNFDIRALLPQES